MRRPCSCCLARHPARIMAHRTGRDALRVPLPAAGKQAGDAEGAVWIYRPRSRLFALHPSRIAAHRARCRRHLSPRQANRTGVSISSRDRRRLVRRPCSCCLARHPARIMAHRTGRDALRVPLPAAGKQAGDAVGAVWIYRPRSRLFARHPSRIAAHRARCRRFPTASKPDRGQHLVTGSAAACAQAVQLLSGAPPCPYLWHYGAAGRMQRRNRTSTRSIAQATVRRMHGRLCPGRRIPG